MCLIINIENLRIKMKKIFKTLPLALIVMSIYSCTSDDETVQDVNDNSSVVTTFTCTQENEGTTTKAAMGPEGKTILWKSGDAISIFDGDGNKQFTLNAGSDGQKSGSFTGKCYESESYVAVYPYTEGATLSYDRKSVSNIVLPDEQEAVDGGFDPKAALMIAKSNTTTLQFKNAVGFIKVTPQFDCKKIILRAANKTQPLAGKGKINIEDPNNPYIDFTGSKELFYSITLSGTITNGNAYYIAVPAVTLAKNWTLTFVTENQNYMRKVTQDITFVRSKALNLGTFAENGDYWAGPRGIVDSSQEVDLGLTITIKNKNYKVIFAKSNLTEDGLAANEYAYGDYFAWGATEPWYSSISGNTFTWKPGKEDGYTEANAPTFSPEYEQNTDFKMSDDPARKILGGDWQLPTRDIWWALRDANNNKVYWETNGNGDFWESSSENKGIKITKKGEPGTYLFLPYAGKFSGTEFDEYAGKYWSGTAAYSGDAYVLSFMRGEITPKSTSSYSRHLGCQVRPVRLVVQQ